MLEGEGGGEAERLILILRGITYCCVINIVCWEGGRVGGASEINTSRYSIRYCVIHIVCWEGGGGQAERVWIS